jgi:hypothetical protein
MSGHHTLGFDTEERLLLWRRNGIDDRDLGLTAQVDDRLG